LPTGTAQGEWLLACRRHLSPDRRQVDLIYIGRWILRVTPLTFCSLRSAMQMLPNVSFRELCDRQTNLGHGSST
jgi:hypothetical protein